MKLPRPPDPLTLAGRLGPDRHVLAAGTQLRRVYFQGPPHGRQWQEFRHYGPLPGARFDHHEEPRQAQARGILYCAPETTTCLAEVFQQTRTINRSRRRPSLVVFELTRDVTLLDLCGDWPTRAGASQTINSGPRDRARAWSAAVYDAYPLIQGLVYRSSMRGGALAVALYDRGEGALAGTPAFERSLDHPDLDAMLRRTGSQLGYRVL